ncbi:M48 family metalloprotease [Tabrizicola sp. J26]|uniref:M48 family metalloprotease n=1 Tax=Alitabrizicola rongguiensis TaxID=2909234 RepID=UPI001F231D3D|nr:M48 family metalloprotease [Tabrizicola rongguiensis]MCF1707385.1 M48 family metalloprotease [Tabrizicola rongguiensis]
MRVLVSGMLAALMLAGCVPTATVPMAPAPVPQAATQIDNPDQAARAFVDVVTRVEPAAEQVCRAYLSPQRCQFQIAIDDRLQAPPNAFQTLDDAGRPVLVFTLALIFEARNEDELAFVMGHEAAHHILGHMSRQEQSAITGAMLAGTLASLGGGSAADVEAAQSMGAQLGARSFSKDYELEADALGTEIAWRAGFDPANGAQFFTRLPDPGNRFLGSHPPNAQRIQTVNQTLDALKTGAR